MVKTIVLAKPKDHQKANLEFLIDSSAFKEKPVLKEASGLILPEYLDIDLVIIGNDSIKEEEKDLLRTNYMIPTILLSEEQENKLIEEYNIYKSKTEIKPDIIPVIEGALSAKEFIDEILGRRPSDFFTGLDKLIEKEILNAKINEQRSISGFEALYVILQREPEVLQKKGPEDIVFETLHLSVVPPLVLYEKTGNFDLVKTAARNFLPVRVYLKDIEGAASDMFDFYVGGSTISEQGIRFMVGINPRKKYDTSIINGYFIRDVQARKKMSNQFIANLRYTVQKYFYNNPTKEVGKFPIMYQPLTYDNISYLIQEALIGPDLESVFLKFRDSIAKAEKKDREKLIKTRDALIDKYFDDLAGWQKHTQRFFSEFPELSKEPTKLAARVARYFKENMESIPGVFQKFINFSQSEMDLWKCCLKDVSASALGLLYNRIVLSMDASSKNVKLHIGRCNPSLDQIIEAICDENKLPDREKIDKVFYHVDTGYVPTHYLEDFFHIVDAYEPAEISLSKEAMFENTSKWFKQYCAKASRKGDANNIITLCLAGAYRNTRRAYLIVSEFQDKNIKFARRGRHSKYKYERFRRLYQNMNEHHIKRAVMYLEKAAAYFGETLNRTSVDENNELYKQHTEIVSKLEKGIDEITAKEAASFLATVQKLQKTAREEKKNKKVIKHLSAMMYRTANMCLAKLTDKMQYVKLPMYEAIIQGDEYE